MENIVNKVKQNRSLVLGIFAALLVGLVLGTGLGGGSVGGLKSSYLGDDSITCTRTCPDGSTIDANNSCPDNQTCTNGATNYPECNNNNTCTNGASNYPDCNDNTCTNGASNYPECDDNRQPGCTDPNARNYNPDAVGDDGSCNYDCSVQQQAYDQAVSARRDANQAKADAREALDNCYHSLYRDTNNPDCKNEQEALAYANAQDEVANHNEFNARLALEECDRKNGN